MTTHIVHLVPKLDILGHLMAFSGALGVVLGQLGARKGFVLLIKWLFGGPRRVPMGHEWASALCSLREQLEILEIYKNNG